MAFSREELRNIGVDDEKIDNIMSLHGKDVQELKDKEEQAKSKASEAQQEVKLYKQRIDEQSSELDDLKTKVNSGENLNEQVEALKQANKQKDEEHQSEMNNVKLRYEIDKELDRAGAKNSIAVMALVNSDDVKLNDDGNGIKGLNEQLKSLKESDSYLFNDANIDNNSQSSNGSEGNDDENNTQQNQDNQFGAGINYNAGQGKGNNGKAQSEGVLGRKNAERLLKK